MREKRRAASLLIGLTFDLKPADHQARGPVNDHFAEHDTEETVSLIERAFKARGHKVIRIGPAKALLKAIKNLNCDIVFNIAEGLYGRNRESEVPVILEAFGIPYTGSDALTLSVSLDKVISKKLFAYHKISTPAYFERSDKDNIVIPKGFSFPMIVKPRYEGSAKGIEPGSKVHDSAALRQRVRMIIETYRQPALIEEFISGWEFTVGIIGNESPEVLPVVQRHVESKTDLSSHVFEKSGIGNDGLRYKEFLEIRPELESEIKDMALAAFRGLECRDFARLDFRVSGHPSSRKKAGVYLLEINPLPSLAKDDYFAMTAELSGIPYEETINKIFAAALERYEFR